MAEKKPVRRIDRTLHDFQFTKKWFLTRNGSTFMEYILPEWKDRPIFYLEIGVFEGMSLTWMMQNVLTHPESKAVGVDPWLMTSRVQKYDMDKIMQRAFHNLSPWSDRCQLLRMNSVEILTAAIKGRDAFGLERESLDICMIDGDHSHLGTWNDARLCLHLLKPGGWMLFDDVENNSRKVNHVKDGVRLFLENQGHRMRFLWKHRYMEAYAKP
jgi:predicted O-methyltransferase YrrM